MKLGFIIGSTVGCLLGILSGIVHALANDNGLGLGPTACGGILLGLVFGLVGLLIGGACAGIRRLAAPSRALPTRAGVDPIPSVIALDAPNRAAAPRRYPRWILWGGF